MSCWGSEVIYKETGCDRIWWGTYASIYLSDFYCREAEISKTVVFEERARAKRERAVVAWRRAVAGLNDARHVIWYPALENVSFKIRLS